MEDIGPAGADEGKGAKYLALPSDSRSRPTSMRSAQSRCETWVAPAASTRPQPAARAQGELPAPVCLLKVEWCESVGPHPRGPHLLLYHHVVHEGGGARPAGFHD